MAKSTKNQNQKEEIMRILKCSSEEADQILADDKAIDQGKRMYFDLSLEDEKAAKKYANSTERKKGINLSNKPKERKPNATKGGLITELATFLTENSEFSTENVEITNKERQIKFQIGDETYELTLVQKRKAKS